MEERMRWGREEIKVIYLLENRQTQLSFLQKVLQEEKVLQGKTDFSKRSFYKAISSLTSKGVLQVHYPIVSLSNKGETLLRYLFPFKPLSGSLFLVSPKVASEETAFRISTLYKQKAPLCYLVVGNRLHIIKNEVKEVLKTKFPLYPLIPKNQLKEYLNLPHYLYVDIKNNPYFMDETREYFVWDIIFHFLLRIGKKNFASYKRINLEEVPYEQLDLEKNYRFTDRTNVAVLGSH